MKRMTDTIKRYIKNFDGAIKTKIKDLLYFEDKVYFDKGVSKDFLIKTK